MVKIIFPDAIFPPAFAPELYPTWLNGIGNRFEKAILFPADGEEDDLISGHPAMSAEEKQILRKTVENILPVNLQTRPLPFFEKGNKDNKESVDRNLS